MPNSPLPNDYSRCYGDGCSTRHSCRRFTTLKRDAAFDLVHGGCLRSYVASLHDPDKEACDHFIEDTQ